MINQKNLRRIDSAHRGLVIEGFLLGEGEETNRSKRARRGNKIVSVGHRELFI